MKCASDPSQLPLTSWRTCRLKFLVELRNAKVDAQTSDLEYVGLEHIESWTGRRINDPLARAEGLASVFLPGDVLFGKLRPYLAKIHLAEGKGMCSTEALVLLSGPDLEPRFLAYQLISKMFIDAVSGAAYGSKMPRASWEDIGNQPILVPSRDEQAQIANFLDWKTGQIDALINKKRTLIGTLGEQHRALVARLVVGNVATHKGASSWFGELPPGWSAQRVKFIGHVGNGSTPNRDESTYWDDGTYPWLNSSVVNQDDVTEADQFVTGTALRECHLPRISPPAVLVGITGQGRTRGMAATLRFEATINQHVAFVKPDESVMGVDYLRVVFDAAYDFLRSESEGGGSTKGAITCEQIAELLVPVPPLEVQRSIAADIRRKAQSIKDMSDSAQTAIDRLAEYRSALIIAAVTGQIDVRGVAVPSPA